MRINENDERYLTLSPVSDSAIGSSNPEFMAKEGGIENGKNELKISLNEPLPYDLDIKYTVGDDPYTTATSRDFTMTGTQTATIEADEMFVTIDIRITDDQLVEPTEYFTLEFGTAGKANDPLNAKGTFKTVNFQDSKLSSQPLSVSIMDNDTAEMQGVVHLRGEGGGGIDGFPSTRKTLTEGQSVIITAEIAGAAPTSDIQIPLEATGFPSDEATSDDYDIPEFITILANQKSGSVTLNITDDAVDERYRELLVVEINDTNNFPTGYTKGDRSKYEVVMLDNDKTPASLTGPALTALTEARGSDTHTATFQLRIDRRPKAAATGMAPFTGKDAGTDEGNAQLVLGYTGTATRGADYNNTPLSFNISKSGTTLPNGCSASGEAVTCTVTLTVKDDNLYEGGAGTTESVKVDLNAGGSSFNDGIKRASGYEPLKLTIEDDDLQPMFSIADVSGPENGNLTFTVKRDGAQGNNVSVTAGTGSHSGATNSATARTDYTEKSGSLRFEKGNTSKTFVVAITDDNIDEDDETFAVTLSNPVDNQGLPEPAIKPDSKTAVGTITDNDDAPTELTISVDTATIAEAADPTTVTVTATIDSDTRFATDQIVTITVGNADNAGEASEGAGGDYETVDQFTITIPATEASGKGTFELTLIDDEIDDDDEKISVEGELGGMTVTHATIKIEDDDTRGITVSKATLTINEADNLATSDKEENKGTYEVALTSQPEGGTVTVDITNPGPTVATADPSSLTFTADNWEMAQTVTMIAKDDTIDDTGDQKTTTITHTVSADGTDYADEKVADVGVTVTDDDEAPTALTITVDTGTGGDQDTISEGADEPTVRITATLGGETQFATDKDITITVGDSDKDTATEGSGGDYATVNDFDITLPAGAESVSHDLTLTLNDDDVDEPGETVTVAGELGGLMVTDTMFTIEDNDATPTVTLVLTPASINESGGTNASTVTATMNGTSSEAVTLEVSATPVSPAVAGDLTLSENTTLTIPANTQASTGDVTIAAVDNDVDAANKTVTVSATATGGNELVAPGNQTLTITDDDTRGITVSKATLTLDEVDNAATMDADEHQDSYTVVLDSEPSGGTVTIGVASGDTTIAGVAPATLTFTASNWDEPQTVTVTAVLDGIDNPDDRRTAAITHTVTATETDYEDATASGVTVTVNDDDGAPTLSINDPSVTEELDDGATAMLTFTVQLKPADGSGNTVTVDYADAGTGTATSGGTDYATLASGTLTFMPGETSKPVAVTVSGDDIHESDETVVVRLSSPSNATLTGGATTLDGTGTINDNDPTPTVSVADATDVSEGNVAAPDPPNNMTFAVTLSAVSGLEVTVPYTLAGTATAGTDYTEPDPRSVMIAAGQTQANIAIPVAGDEVDEENETITVTLGMPTNATVSTAEGAGAASGTITDDDTRGVSVTPTALTVAEEDNTSTAATREDQETYEVVLTSQPTGAVTVNLTSGDESVARINTASLVFDADDWNMARTVTVTGQADVIDNTSDMRATKITHMVSADGTDYEDETAEGVAVTVTDDDAAPSGITLTASPDSVTENGGAKTITVTAAVNGATRYAAARTVSVSVGGRTAISGTDYTAVESFDITIGAGEDDATNTFTLTPENDVLAEDDETIEVTGTLSGITITPDEITLTDDDEAPSGITLTVDTNGAEDGAQTSVGEDAGATLVTVTATVNGETRYVDAKTVAVSVADGTAASPADYAAVNNFNITIAAGAASQTGSFTMTPVDDDLDEANETIDVAGTLSSVTITAATVTFTDNDDPVSFSIADAEATEGGKVTFTVSRAGAGDNVATVKVATATDSGDGVNAADADDYTAISTAQTLNFAKGVTSRTVEVQTTQDDLFEPDETFKAVLSAPALADGDPGTGVSIEMGKGMATGTIKNDDTQPSFAVADASASEGDAITFTVTRSGAMDNAVSVKWNTKAATGAGAAATSDYTAMTTATKLDFAKGVGTQTFTVATTEDVLDEENETFLVELTGAVGATIATAEATGTINDDDAAPGGITLSVDTNGSTSGTPNTVAEDAGATVVTVTATVNGTTRYVDAKTVAVSVADDTAASPADYAAVSNFSITIAAGAASHTGSFTVTPVDDDLDESNETINVTGTLSSVTITGATVTFTDNDDPVSFSIADAEATEGGKVTFTVSRKGAEDNVASVKVATAADSGDGVKAAGTDDYTAIATAQTLNFAKGVTSQTVEVQTTQDDLFEPDETFRAVLSAPALGENDPGTGVSIESGKGTAIGTIKNDDTQPSFAVADASASEGDAITFTVTRSGAMDNAVSVKWNTKADSSDGANAASASDYTAMPTATKLDFAKGEGAQTFTVATTEDVLHEGDETFLVELTGAVGATIATAQATGTINDDDDAPGGITLSVDTNGAEDGTPSTVAEDAGATVVTVTATVNGTTRYVEARTVVVSVDDDTAASPADYAAVSSFNITIAAGAASHTGSFTVTPVDDDLDEANETIDVTGTLSGVTVTAATVTLTDTDDPVSFSIADAEATEGGKVTFTVSRKGAEDNVASVKIATAADSGDDVDAAGTSDYTAIATAQTLNFAAGDTIQTVEVQTTQDDLFEPDETFRAVLSAPALADGDPGTGVSIETGKGTATGTIKNDDTEPSFAVADASASEGDAITFTVTRSGAMDNAVSVKWNTKADSSDGANVASATDYTPVPTAQTLTFAKGVGTQTFTVATTEDVLDEENETFLVELTGAVGATIATAEATGTINDDDAAPGGITLSVDTNGSTSGTPNTVAEDAGATVVTVTATVNGTTRYVDAKTVAVSVADDTAASPADYAAVSNFSITIAAGAASHTGSFTVTPVDDDLDESNETINVTGTLSSVTITGATVTFTDNDDPVSFSIADAEATEGGKVTFTVSRKGAEDNVASVKVATAADSGDGVKAAGTDDYTAIATAQTLNFAKGVTSQTVEVQTTQDDLFEPDETFRAVLSAPALGENDPGTGVSIESGKGTAIGTIKNDDTQPSFAVADASASEGDAITFTVTRSGAMDNAVSVKWNTKADSSDGANAASASDYTAMPTATKLDFAKGEGAQTFAVATTEDTLHEGNETFLVELTEATGGTIATAEATGTINDDDAAPTGITLTVSPATVGEGAGETEITVTATVNGTTRYVDAKTVTVSVGGGTATSATDYDAVANFDIVIAAGDASKAGTFDLTPTDDDLHEGSETIDVTGTSNALTITKASITLEDDDAQPSFAVADASASEGDAITFTVTRSGAMDNAVSVKWNTKADSSDGANAASGSDYTEMTTATKLDFAKGVSSQSFTVATTEDTLNEANETFLIELTEPVGATITTAEATGTITNDDAAPTTLALAVDADNATENVQSSLAENGGAKTVKVTATLGGSTQFDVDKTLTLIVGDDDDSATEGTDYTNVADVTLTIPAGDQDVEHTFTLTPTDDAFREDNETISFDATLTGVTVAGASITLTSDDAAPAITLTVDADKDTDNIQTSLAEDGGVKTVRVTATLDGTTRLEEAADLTLAVGKHGDSAVEDTDYSTVADRTITIGAGVASVTDDFTLTPTNDDLYEGSETISLDGTLTGVTVTDTSLTLTDDDAQPSFAVADASASEGDAITFTVTRSGAMDNAVSVKWNTKAATGAGAAATSDYTAMTTATKLDFAKGVGTQTFTVATTEDVLDEENETFLVELTGAVGATIATAEATGTINDDDAAPGGITLSVDTNGSTSGTPNTVAEDAGATVVTVTATVNGTTRYVDAKTVAVSVADDTAASPADYAAVSNFSITIAAGAASHTGSFTVTPVDDDLDESNETINVTGTLSSVTITGATVTFTDNDDPVSFSIADAEATEGGKVTFTVSRKGAEDNVASVKVATAADSGDGVKAAGTDDYTAIATAQTLNFAKGVTSQTVEVQTTQDDLFEPDETFRAVLSAPALGENDPGTGVSIESGKGTAIGTIKNDDTQPSFAVADASASEGDAITFTVTRSGAMDNAVSVKWNTKADSSDGANAASASDYTAMPTATKLDFAKGEGAQTFTVATTEDVLHEGDETFLVELTGAVGATIATAQATGTINDDDAAPTGITLTVSPATVGEGAGETEITVTATVNGTTRYVDAKTVTVSVGGGTATSATDYDAVANFDIVIAAGDASKAGTFDLTPTQDDLHEGSETIGLDGTVTGVTVTDATLTLTDDDGQPSFAVADASADEGDTITFTVTRSGAMDNAVSVKWNTKAATGAGAAATTDYTAMPTATKLDFASGASSQSFTVATTEDTLNEANETFLIELTEPVGATITTAEATGTITNDDAAPTTLTLAVDADNNTENVQSSLAENGGAKTVKVTATLGGATQFDVDKTLTLIVGDDDDSATEGTDYTNVADVTLTIPAGDQDVEHTFTLTPTDDAFNEASETISFDATLASFMVTGASITLTSDDAAPAITLTVDADKDTDNVQTSLAEDGGVKTVRVTATLDGTTRLEEAADLTLAVGKSSDSAVEGTDYANVADRIFTIGAGVASVTHDFPLTPTNDDIDEPDEGISIEGTLAGVTVTGTSLTITDDEGTPTVTLMLTPTAIDESGNGNASTVTATLSGKSSVAVTLTVAAAAGASTASGDFTLSGTTLTIAAGATTSTGAVTITAVDNDVDAPNKTVTVSATASGGGVANPGNQTLTITDDEGVPTVTLALDPTTIDESGDDNASTVTATLSGKSNEAVTLTVAATAGADTASGDFTLSGTTLTIAAGATTSTGTVTITAVDNDVDAPNKSVTVSAVASGGGVADPGNQTLTITDDEGVPTATLVLDPTAIDESGDDNASTVTATLSGKSNEAVTLTVAAAAGANTASGDFTLSGTTLTIAAGATTSTGAVTITAVDNDVDAPNKTVTVSATASGGGVANPGNQTLTITDDEGVPTVTLALDPTAIDESGDDNASTVTATLSGKSNEAVTLTVAAAAGASTASGDFTLSGTTLTIAAGATTSTGAVTITAVDNDVDAPNKSVTVSATASGGGVSNPDNQALTINDDDDAPSGITLSVSPATVGEEDGKTQITVTATVNGTTRYVDAKTVTVSVGGGTAISGTDYDAVANFDITIAAGDASKTGTFDLTPINDVLDEANETINVTGTSGSLTITSTTVTINDDDDAPGAIMISVDADTGTNGTQTTIAENGSAKTVRVTATITDETRFVEAKTVTLEVGVDADSATEGADYANLGTRSITINAGSSSGYVEFTLTPTNDVLHEGNETISLDGTLMGVTVTDATITLTDDDAAPTGITLTVSPATVGEGAGETEITVTATVNGTTRYVDAKTVTVSVGGGTATSATDYDAVANFDIVIAAGDASKAGTFDLTPTQDDLHEGSETIGLDGTVTGVTVTDATLTLTDDDGQPSFAVADASADEGDTITFTVTRSGAMDNAVSVKWNTKAATGAGAAATTDYTAMPTATKLDFASGASSQSFTVATTEDTLHEGNETFLVELTEPVGGIISDAEATGTITNDDAAPTALTLSVDADTGTMGTQTSLAEDGGVKTVRVTATLGGNSTFNVAKTVAVEIGADADGATEGTDYANLGTQNITINAGASSGYVEFTLTPTDDDIDEPDEGISIEGTLASVTVTGTSLTITDDEGTPTVTLVLTPTTINESGNGNASMVTATLSGESSAAVTVEVSVPNDAPVTLSATTTLTIAAGSKASTGTVTITAVDNDVDAPNASVVVSGVAAGGGVAVANPGNQTLTITDDEGTPTVTLVLTPTTINETGATNSSTVKATLSGKSNTAVTLTVAAAAGTDTAARDFTVSNNKTLTIAAGATTSTGAVTITAVDNDVDAPNKTVTVSATASGGSVADPTDQTLTITDDEGVPTVTLALDPTTINESGNGNASTVTATLSGKSSAAVTLTVAAAAGADTAAGDFTLSGTTLTIAAGATTSTGAVTITAVDNDVDAPNKTVTVSATASGGGVANPGNQTLTITDDEGVPTVTLALDPTTVNESGNGNASTVTATLSGESSAAVTVTVSVPNNAPVTLSANKTLTIAAGAKASTGTVTITAVDNDVDAANASVVVSGVAAGGSVANPADQTLTITDDEGTPTATLVLAPTTIDESGATNSSTVTATLSGKSNTAVTLTVAAAAGADTVAGDFTVSGNKTLTIAAGARTSTGTVKITAVNNNVDAPDKSVTVSATASGGGVANPDNQILTITDDDAAPSGITLSVSPATLGEGNGLTTITVTATVNGSTRYVDAKTVTVSVGSGTAIAGTDFGSVSNFDITIAAGDASKAGTFDLTPTDDALHEEDETIEVTGSSGALTITPATVTITDNDASGPEGTVSLSASRYEVLEGDSLSVTVKLSESPAADTVIELEATSPSGHTATPGTDYDGAVQTVTIRAGATSGQARISTTRDNRNDPNETFKLAIRASELPGTVTLGEPDTAVVTIRERVSGITPPATATVKYAGRKSRILMPVPAGLKGHGIDVAFYFDWGPGTAQGGGDCREPGTDVVDWGHWPSFPEGMVRTGPLVRIAEDIDTDTIELEIELCEGSVGKTFTATWDTVQWLGNPDRGFPGFKSYPFNAAAAHCTSTALCWTKVTIIGDTPDPDPEVTISAGSDITEGGDAVFTVQATPAPKSDLEVTLAIADDAVSDFLADGEEGSKTVTIAAGSDTATYTLATTDDDLEEAIGGVSATLAAGAGYQVGSPATATVAVADNDDDDDTRATIVRITGGAEITEGSVARFTLTGAPASSQDITVNLRVTQSGAFSGDGELGARTVTLGADATVTVDIPTVDDSTLEDDGSLTITVEPGTGYTPHATDASATVAVVDNEEPSLPTIHIDDVEAAEGDDLHFTFTLSHAVDHEVDVWWETRFGTNPHDDENGHGPSYGEAIPHADFRYADSRVTVYPGSTRGEFWVETFDDSHDEGRETLTVVLTEATGAIIADELAIGTIVNSDPMPAAWLGRFGRAVAEQALDGIAGRIAAPRTAGMQGMVAGQALSFGGSTGFGAASPHGSLSGTSLSERARLSLSDIDRLFGDERAADRSRTLSGRDLLLSSRFTLTGERDATGGNLAFWGRAAQSGFDGREGRFSLDGEAMTAMLGADYARDRWLAGMALMRSSGKGGGSYADPGSESGAGSGSVRGAGGKVEATLTAAIPYLTLQASERVKLWGALGHGVGEVMLKPELGEMLKSDISWSMASLGLRGDLLPTKESPGSESGSGAGGPALALVSDALWAGTSSEKTRGLAASESNVTRLRLGLEGSWKVPLEGDASITPKLEMGMRHDGGDAETGFGVELGGGITWMDPRLGLSLDFSGRALVAHDAGELENRGFATSLAFDPDPASERGLSFALRQDWGGQAEGGLDALFQADPLSDRTGSGSTSGSRWSAEGAYGFPAFSGRFISSPHMGLGLATGARDSSLGWRLTPARNEPDFSFGLKATRRESDGAGPEHTLGFEISARW